jgi:hypothetical protein
MLPMSHKEFISSSPMSDHERNHVVKNILATTALSLTLGASVWIEARNKAADSGAIVPENAVAK